MQALVLVQALGERSDVQDAVAKLCCTWWQYDADQKELLVSQTLPYLLVSQRMLYPTDARSAVFTEQKHQNRHIKQFIGCLLQVRAVASKKPAHVKACYTMRTALELLDFDDPSIADMKRMLLHAAMSPGFLYRPEGRKFLSCLLVVHPSMVREVTAIIRNQVCRYPQPACTQPMMSQLPTMPCLLAWTQH